MVYFKFLRPDEDNFTFEKATKNFTRLFVPAESNEEQQYCYAEIPNGYFSLFVEQFKVYGKKLAGIAELPDGIEMKYQVIRPE